MSENSGDDGKGPVYQMIDDLSVEDQRNWATDTGTDQGVLTVLSQSNDALTRRNVAENVSTPQEVLDVLVSDQNEDVRASAVGNPNLRLETLNRVGLRKDELGAFAREKAKDRTGR